MSLGYDTSINTSNGTHKAIRDFSEGDLIWVAETPELTSWVQKPVLFSPGTGTSGNNQLINVGFSNCGAEPQYILVSRTQPFLMHNKTLKQAKKLIPGKDQLVMEDGTLCPIISIEVAVFNKGVHHVTTSRSPAENLNFHLMLANGIVIGDYATILNMRSGNPPGDI